MSDPNAGVIQILSRTRPWIRLVSIFGFLTVGLFALLGAVSWIGIASERVERVPIVVLVVYPVLMVLAFVPAWCLHKCARCMDIFVAQGHTVQLEAVLESLRVFWKFVGTVAAVIAAAVALMLAAAIVVGVLAAL